MSTILPNYVLVCVKIRGFRSQTPAAAQSTALRATSFTNYPASIALRKIQDWRAPTQVLPPGQEEVWAQGDTSPRIRKKYGATHRPFLHRQLFVTW